MNRMLRKFLLAVIAVNGPSSSGEPRQAQEVYRFDIKETSGRTHGELTRLAYDQAEAAGVDMVCWS